MNKRLTELLGQCQQESIDGPEYPRWTDLEKFAELIVRECATRPLKYKNEQHYQGWQGYRDAIEEHFKDEA
jgi:hypothetical protein